MDLLSENIGLNERNKLLIKKAGKQYNVIALLLIVWTLFSLLTTITRLYKYLGADFEGWYDTFNLKIYSFLFIAYCIITCVQTYYYYTGVKLQNYAIEHNDQESFDLSFRYYVYGNRFSITSMLITIPTEIIFLYQELFIFE